MEMVNKQKRMRIFWLFIEYATSTTKYLNNILQNVDTFTFN